MALKASFGEVDITPPIGTHKIGWLKDIISTEVRDPLFARIAVLESERTKVGFVQLDTLSVRWSTVAEIRRRAAKRYGFPPKHLMVAATHNHAGPAVANVGDVPRDDAYVEAMVEKVVGLLGRVLEARQEAAIGFGSGFEWTIAHNRRTVMRDGTVRTQQNFKSPEALCFEGPIDPELAVIAARGRDGRLLGCLVNFACHPTHHGGTAAFSAGYPGALAAEMKRQGCPVTLFLNGACGNIIYVDFRGGVPAPGMEEIGKRLADKAAGLIGEMTFREELRLGCRVKTIQLPYRAVTEDQIKGTARGAQRFIDPKIYDHHMPALVERIAARGTQPAEVQVILMDDHAIAGIPAEYFVENGLRIKEGAWPRRALVSSHTNGMVGYVPHKAAFERGGYETTFAASSRLAPEAGDMLADCAIELITTTQEGENA